MRIQFFLSLDRSKHFHRKLLHHKSDSDFACHFYTCVLFKRKLTVSNRRRLRAIHSTKTCCSICQHAPHCYQNAIRIIHVLYKPLSNCDAQIRLNYRRYWRRQHTRSQMIHIDNSAPVSSRIIQNVRLHRKPPIPIVVLHRCHCSASFWYRFLPAYAVPLDVSCNAGSN